MTNEQLTEIRKRAEAAKEMPFYTWEASELIEQDVPKLLAEIERLGRDLQAYRKYNSLYVADRVNGFTLAELIEHKLAEGTE